MLYSLCVVKAEVNFGVDDLTRLSIWGLGLVEDYGSTLVFLLWAGIAEA